MISVRRARAKDKDAILELLFELGRPRPKNTLEKVRFTKLINDYMSDKDKLLIVACADSVVVGLISAVLLTRLNRTTYEMYVPELVVSSEYQNRGIGKKLMDHCIKIAKKKNCFRVRLESGYQRKSSHRFYKKIGFEDYALTFRKQLG